MSHYCRKYYVICFRLRLTIATVCDWLKKTQPINHQINQSDVKSKLLPICDFDHVFSRAMGRSRVFTFEFSLVHCDVCDSPDWSLIVFAFVLFFFTALIYNELTSQSYHHLIADICTNKFYNYSYFTFHTLFLFIFQTFSKSLSPNKVVLYPK